MPQRIESNSVFGNERRIFRRTNQRVLLLLLSADSSLPVVTETENVGVDGFFCYTEQPFAPGDHLKFWLLLPPPGTSLESSGRGLLVYGDAQVTRVTIDCAEANCRIECTFQSYSIASNSKFLAGCGKVKSTLDASLAKFTSNAASPQRVNQKASETFSALMPAVWMSDFVSSKKSQ